MSDLDLRELERAWRASGDPEDHARFLQARIRTGQIPHERVELAAFLGDPAACAAVAVRSDDAPWNPWAKTLDARAARVFVIHARCLFREVEPPVEPPAPPDFDYGSLAGLANAQTIDWVATPNQATALTTFDPQSPPIDPAYLAAVFEEGLPPQLRESFRAEWRARRARFEQLFHDALGAQVAFDPEAVRLLSRVCDAYRNATVLVDNPNARSISDQVRAAERVLRGSTGEFTALREAATSEYAEVRAALIAWALA